MLREPGIRFRAASEGLAVPAEHVAFSDHKLDVDTLRGYAEQLVDQHAEPVTKFGIPFEGKADAL